MKPRNLVILLAVAILLGGLAYYRGITDRRQDTVRPASGQPVFPDLDINRIDTVVLQDGQSRTTLQHTEDHWGVVERYGYPVNFNRLRNLLTAVNDLTVGRPLFVDQAVRRELRLLRPDHDATTDGTGVLIDMRDDRDDRLAALTLGMEFHREFDPQQSDMPFQWRGAEGRYIMTHDDQAMLVSEPFGHVSADPDSWIDRQFLNIPGHALVAMTWRDGEAPKPPVAELSRDTPGDPWRIDPLPEGQQLDRDVISEFTASLSGLSFSEIADPADDRTALNLVESTVTLTVRADDGREYHLTTGPAIPDSAPPRHAMYVSADYHLPAPDPRDAGADTAAAQTQAEQVQQHAESIRRINDRLAPWIYLIDAETAQRLRGPAATWFTPIDAAPDAE